MPPAVSHDGRTVWRSGPGPACAARPWPLPVMSGGEADEQAPETPCKRANPPRTQQRPTADSGASDSPGDRGLCPCSDRVAVSALGRNGRPVFSRAGRPFPICNEAAELLLTAQPTPAMGEGSTGWLGRGMLWHIGNLEGVGLCGGVVPGFGGLRGDGHAHAGC